MRLARMVHLTGLRQEKAVSDSLVSGDRLARQNGVSTDVTLELSCGERKNPHRPSGPGSQSGVAERILGRGATLADLNASVFSARRSVLRS